VPESSIRLILTGAVDFGEKTMKRATAVEYSENAKLGGMSTTYSAFASCPASCPFKKSRACYGFSGPIGYQWGKLGGRDVDLIAKDEAAAILGLSGNLDLRIHTLGDCSTDNAAKIVSTAAEVFMSRRKKTAFTYTHGWRNVKRASWGKVSVIASCETPKDVKKALARGYATAIVVPKHPSEKRYEYQGINVVPCPQQTGRCKSCSDCRLCLQADKLKAANVTIAFEAHGPSLKMKAVLEKLV
jgi:hypothetical protein